MSNRMSLFLSFLVGFAVLAPRPVPADEGMWLFEAPPRELVKKNYGFELTDDFLDHLRRSSVRFSNGGSGSFVSSDGLVMTNHHIAESCLQRLNTPTRNLLANGFYAKRMKDELKCDELELVMLDESIDVTARVAKSVAPGMSASEAEEARRAVINTIEQESRDETGMKSQVVTLYKGGLYHLYRYKRFDDVRIVFAPEVSTGFFGGEPDNFEYPRYNLDMAFFRVYENGKPYEPDHYLKWSPEGAKDGELVFVSGHPGRTNRGETIAHLEFRRDVELPYILNRLRRREVLLQIYSERGTENAARVASDLFRVRNSRKNRTGILLGLQTPAWMESLAHAESELATAAKEKKLLPLDKYNPWDAVRDAMPKNAAVFVAYQLLEANDAFDSQLYQIAKNIVRYTEESVKPNSERLREFSELELDGVRDKIMTKVSIYTDLELITLADSFALLLENPGLAGQVGTTGLYPDVREWFGQLSPKEKAAQLIRGTKLADRKERRKLLDGGRDAVANSTDPMIVFARNVDKAARDIRKYYEAEIEEPLRTAYAQLAQLRFKLASSDPEFAAITYPDATFTLRLAVGKVAGYTDDDGTKRAPWTTMNGAFEHAESHDYVFPYNLPSSWRKAKDSIDLATPLNIVSTNDIIGGNSGSPLVNGKGEIVGLIFDGNIQSLAANFIYTEQQARAVSVHSAAMIEGLRKIYHADRIVKEIAPPTR